MIYNVRQTYNEKADLQKLLELKSVNEHLVKLQGGERRAESRGSEVAWRGDGLLKQLGKSPLPK